MTKVQTLINQLGIDPAKCVLLSSGGSRIDFEYQISPREFLRQAASDLHAGGTAALQNSLTNSRRAILCQIDRILEALGFDAHSISTKTKSDLLAFLGLPTPVILRKVGALRNDLEHRYKSPPLDRVEDAHDIAMLFIEAIDRYMDTFWGDFYIGQQDEHLDENGFGFKRQLEFQFSVKKRAFKVIGIRQLDQPRFGRDIVGQVALSSASPLHKHCVRLALTEFSRIPDTEAVSDLFHAVSKE